MSSSSDSEFTIEQQCTLVSALSRAEAYPHSVEEIQLIETHISWVFLTGHYAYKIKKSVNFGFLDFSSLDKRRFFCEEELRLNRRLAPDLYLDVVPICGPAQSATIGGSGEAIEYAVKMLQFDTQNTFDVLLEKGTLSTTHIAETAQVLAQFHSSTTIADAVSPYGTPKAIQQPAMENFDQLTAAIQKTNLTDTIEDTLKQLRHWIVDQHADLTHIFKNRKNSGFIRECHGDLHLRNIVIWEGRITPFDCIEFNDNLRWTDVISELAFLLMDLDDHQQPVLARQLLNTYLFSTGDYEGLRVLRYYQVYRAMVRTKVAGLMLGQNQRENAQHRQEINNYIQLASSYTQAHAIQLIITHGLSGSGKSYLSKQLSHAADIIHLRSDVERKRLFGLSQHTKTTSGINEGIYTPEITQKTYQQLLQLSRSILTAGFSVLVDATFLQHQYRDIFKSLADELNLPFTILHCEADNKTLKQRVQQRQEKERDASEANEAVLDRQQGNQKSLTDEEDRHTHKVRTTDEIDISELLCSLNLMDIKESHTETR